MDKPSKNDGKKGKNNVDCESKWQKDDYQSVPGIQRDRIIELLKEANIKVNKSGGSERIDCCDRYQWPSYGKSR